MPDLLDQYAEEAAPAPQQGDDDPLAGLVDRLNEQYYGGQMPSSQEVRQFRGEQQGALGFLQEHAANMGDQSRVTGAGDQMTLENPDDPTSPRRHGNLSTQQWNDVAAQVRQNFPSVDPEQFRPAYSRMRFEARQAGAIDFYRRAFQSGAEDPQRTVGQGGLLQYLPFTSAPAVIRARVNGAAERVAEGRATDHDYAVLGADLANQDQGKSEAWSDKVVNLLKRAPGFAAELGATFGLSQILGRGVAAGASRAFGTSAAGTLATRAAGLGSGIAAQTALNPAAIGSATLDEMGRPVGTSRDGVQVGQGRPFGESLARGFANQAIEVGTERAGGLIPGVGILGPRATQFLRRAGINSLGGEMFEERLGEVLKGVTGLANDYGTTGDVFAGRWRQAASQLSAEAVGFGIFGHAAGLTERAADSARQLPAGGPSIHTLPPMGEAPTPQEIQRYNEVAARVQEGNARATARWAATAPISELKAWESFYPSLSDVIQARRRGSPPAAAPVVAQVQADMNAVNATATALVHQEAQGPQPGQEAMPAENAVPEPGGIGGGNEGKVTESPQPSTTLAQVAPTGQNLTTAPVVAPPATTAQTAPVPAQAPAPTQAAPNALAGQPGASSGMSAVVAPSAAHVTKAPPQALAGLWLRHFAGDAGVREQINAQAKLSPKEAAILWSRLPVEQGGDGKTLAQVGQEQGGVSRQRIEQVEKKARAKAAFDVSVNEFKQQAAGLQREGASVTTAKEAGLRATSKEGFQARETPDRPEDIVSDRMLAILQEADATGKPLTEAQKQSVYSTCADLMQQVENDARRNKSKGFTAKRIEAAFRKGLEAAEDRAAGAQAGSADTAASSQTERRAQGTQRVQAQSDVRLARGAASGTAEREFKPVTADELDAVAKLSPHHAALVGKVRSFALSANLPIQKKVEYLRNQVTILNGMPAQAAAIYNANLKKINYHIDADTLTRTVARESDVVRDAMSTGYIVPGVYHRGTGVMNLDGESEFGTGARVAGHEAAHAMDGPQESISNASDVKEAYVKEALKGVNGEYSRESPHEFLAEFLGLIHSGEMTVADAQAKMPLMYQAMLSRGLIEAAQGKGAMTEAPADIFDRAINDGPLHADATRLARIQKRSKEFEAARAQVNPTGVANPTATTNKEAIQANKDAAAINFRQRADDNKAIATEIGAAAAKKRARLGLPVAHNDLRTVLARADQSVAPWAEQLASDGAFALDLQPNGSRKMRTFGKPLGWMTEGMNYKPEDLKSMGTGPIDRLKRKFGFPVEQGASRLGTMLVALHAVHQVERGQAMLDKYLTFITPEQEAVAARLINTVSTEQLKAFDAYVQHEREHDREFFANANESLRRLAQLNDWTLETLQSVGWYNAEDVARIKRDYPDYVSMARIIEGDEVRRGGGNEIKPGWEKKRHGSDKQILDPIRSLESRYALTAVIIAKQLKDQALLEAARSLEGEYLKPAETAPGVRLTDISEKLTALGIDKAHQAESIAVIGPELIEHFGAPKWDANGKNFYIMRENGQRVAMEMTSKPLYDLMTGNQEATKLVGGITQFIQAIPGLAQLPKLVKWGATTANLVFPVRNVIRDPWHALQNSDKPFLPTLGGIALGLRDSLVASGQTVFGKQLSDPFARLYFQSTGQQLREFAYTKGGAGHEEFGRLKGESPGLRKTVKVAHKIQEVLELIGFGEHGPRLAAFGEALEEKGYTKADVAAAMKADPSTAPIPIDVIFSALQRAAERTTDFSRQGIDVREFNKIAPFFSPQIAGMSQEIRNWDKAAGELRQGKFGRVSKAMLGTLAMYLGLELMHWWRYKDDEWYKNLPAHLRYGWWILGQDKQGGTWGVPKPQGTVRMVGAYLQELLRTASKSDPRFGMASADVADQLIPRVAPIGVAEAFQVARNKDWRGANIVPKRDLDELNAWEQFRRYQLPYVLDQMTGGLASARVLRGPHEAFQSSRSEPSLPVNDYFERLQALTGAHAQATRARLPMPADQAREYARLHFFEESIRRLSKEARGELGTKPSPERLREIRRLQNQLARRAMGQA